MTTVTLPRTGDSHIAQVKSELEKVEGPSIIRLVELLVEHASAARASDIHIDPTPDSVRVRLRVDGVLHEIHSLPPALREETIARVKILCGLRTDEHQAAQDGRFRHFLNDDSYVDVRVSIVPTYHGENAVLRLLQGHAEDFTLETLGFSHADRAKIAHALKKPSGMVLVTGPTGSGKTTTLYTLIRMMNAPGVSIVTIEDPIEYAISNTEQIQVNPRSGLSFANGLRSILRQDPDIIMVGEIRDSETAAIAVNTALTGHLLLSTLHTNDASSTLPRLLDMGIDTYLVASTVSLTVGQRLVRRICPACREAVSLTPAEFETLSALTLAHPLTEGKTFYHGRGCASCSGTGYAGRLSVNEVIVCDAAIRDAILRKAPATEIKRIATAGGMTTMLEDGFAKAGDGQTSVSEVLRVVYD